MYIAKNPPNLYATIKLTIMNHKVISFCLIGILLLSVKCSNYSLNAQSKTLTILHTNDLHASVYPHEATWIQGEIKPLVGGFAELSWTIDSIRKVNKNILLLDGGDVMTGSPISDYEYKGAVGGVLFDMMNMIGYDGWTIGNHDFDISQDNLRKLTTIAKFPTLSANVRDSSDNFHLNNKPYIIIERAGLKIGIIGLMSDELFSLVNTKNLAGMKVLPGNSVAQEIVNRIDQETDLIIAVTHRGVAEDSMLAVAVSGIDVIVGGHSHTRLRTPKVVNGVVIVQTGYNCENLGVLDISVKDDKVISHNGKLIQLWARGHEASPEMRLLMNEFKAKIDKEYSEGIATLSEDWKRSGREYALGNFYTDAIREAANAQVAFANSSGIRKDLLAGEVTKLDLVEIAPFRNFLCTFEITGKQLREIVQRHVQLLVDGNTRIHFSGVQCTWKRENGMTKILTLAIDGKEVHDEGVYRCATHDYFLNQIDRYLEIQPQKKDCTDRLMFDVLVEKVKKERQLRTPEMRFTEIK